MDAHQAGVLELSLSQKYDPSRRDMEVLGSNPDPDAAPEVEDVDVQSEIASLGMKIKSVTIESSLGAVTGGTDWTLLIEHGKIALPALAGILGAWLHARYGRKVRLKIGDIEAEAQTAEEVEKLLDKAHEIQQRSQPTVIHEP